MIAGLTGTKMLMGGASFGIVAVLWGHFKAIFLKIYAFFIEQVEICSGELKNSVSLYCNMHYKKNPFYIKSASTYELFLRNLNRYGNVAIERYDDNSVIFWTKKWFFPIPVILSSGENKSRLIVIRGIVSAEKIIADAVDYYNKRLSSFTENKKESRFYIKHVFGSIGKGGSDQGRSSADKVEPSGGGFDETLLRMGVHKLIGVDVKDIGFVNKDEISYMSRLFFPPEVDSYVEEARRWINSEEWYLSKGITWKRSWGLVGPPGTGKSSLVRALAELLGIPLYIFDLTTMTNEDLVSAWRRMASSSPCMALIEDFDSVFDGRENSNKVMFANSLTFDCFLNVMDGVEKSSGIFSIITTNYADKLDPALGLADGNFSTRPGRIDRLIELGSLDESCRRKLAESILGDVGDVCLETLVREGDGDSGAKFQERCSRIALEKYWAREYSAEDLEVDKTSKTFLEAQGTRVLEGDVDIPLSNTEEQLRDIAIKAKSKRLSKEREARLKSNPSSHTISRSDSSSKPRGTCYAR